MEKTEIIYLGCCIGLTPEEWDKLEALDFLEEVDPKLAAVEAWDIEYSGHFGRNIYFKCKQEDLQNIENKIKELICD